MKFDIMSKESILKAWKEHSYSLFANHVDLKALVTIPDPYYEDIKCDYQELVFTIPKTYLFEQCKKIFNIPENEVQFWLENEYTSDESSILFLKALEDAQVVTLYFN